MKNVLNHKWNIFSWNTQCKGKHPSHIPQFPALRMAISCLHSTPWQTCKQTPSRFLRESFSHAAINAQKETVHKYPPLSTVRHSPLIELEQGKVNKFPRGSNLRVQCSSHCTPQTSTTDTSDSFTVLPTPAQIVLIKDVFGILHN